MVERESAATYVINEKNIIISILTEENNTASTMQQKCNKLEADIKMITQNQQSDN